MAATTPDALRALFAALDATGALPLVVATDNGPAYTALAFRRGACTAGALDADVHFRTS